MCQRRQDTKVSDKGFLSPLEIKRRFFALGWVGDSRRIPMVGPQFAHWEGNNTVTLWEGLIGCFITIISIIEDCEPLHKRGKWLIFFWWIQTPGFRCFNAYEGSKSLRSAKTIQKPAIFDKFSISLDKKWIKKMLRIGYFTNIFSQFSAYSKCCPPQELR